MTQNREAALAALKAIRAEIAKAETNRLKGLRAKKNTPPAPEKAETPKEE